ncbi:MAG: hypothetical protein N2050_04810 [Flavobacteriales bacterium]|nr:hypothetical protein [Flavobacteriales bacterium]
MFSKRPSIGQELLDVPMGDMIREMAFAIADAQIRLDANSIEVAQMMGGLKTIKETIGGREVVTFQDSRVFFGKEKITIKQAVDILNSSNDDAYNQAILGAAGINIQRNNSTNLYEVKTNADPDYEITIPTRVSMLELGFTPTFYQFVDTIIEVKISIKYTQEGSRTFSSRESQSQQTSQRTFLGGIIGGFVGGTSNRNTTVVTSQVNASYSQKYSYSAEGASLLRTKLVPIPPPAVLEERIRRMMELEFDKPIPQT